MNYPGWYHEWWKPGWWSRSGNWWRNLDLEERVSDLIAPLPNDEREREHKEYWDRNTPVPKIQFCPFCKSTRLRRSLSSYLCKACGWWFKVIDQAKETSHA